MQNSVYLKNPPWLYWGVNKHHPEESEPIKHVNECCESKDLESKTFQKKAFIDLNDNRLNKSEN